MSPGTGPSTRGCCGPATLLATRRRCTGHGLRRSPPGRGVGALGVAVAREGPGSRGKEEGPDRGGAIEEVAVPGQWTEGLVGDGGSSLRGRVRPELATCPRGKGVGPDQGAGPREVGGQPGAHRVCPGSGPSRWKHWWRDLNSQFPGRRKTSGFPTPARAGWGRGLGGAGGGGDGRGRNEVPASVVLACTEI